MQGEMAGGGPSRYQCRDIQIANARCTTCILPCNAQQWFPSSVTSAVYMLHSRPAAQGLAGWRPVAGAFKRAGMLAHRQYHHECVLRPSAVSAASST